METQILPSDVNQVDTMLGDTYVKFQLEQQTTAILSMEYVQELIIVPTGRIAPMPNMPECVLGLLNRRNRVFWVIDLAQMLNLQPVNTNTQQYQIVIIRVGQVPLGLAVGEVKGVIKFTPDWIQSAREVVTASVNFYVQGYILHQQETLLVLNTEAIVHSPILHSD